MELVRQSVVRRYSTSDLVRHNMEISQEQKDNMDKGNKGYGLLNIIVGAIMVWQGDKYMDSCPNGAAWYLYLAGILLLVTNLIGIIFECSQWLAERDGKITCCESFGLGILTFGKGIMAVVNFVIIIWGSVVVFGAWSDWSYAPEDSDKEIYCPYTPMMFVFVQLIVYWVLIPVMMVLMCCCGTMMACCACCTKGSGNV